MNKTSFQQSLLNWYDHSKRVLPWRDQPNPYHVWLSEIMLQQTRVEAVLPYFFRFIDKIPSIQILSQTDDDVLNKLWEGLGYYSRIRNMKKASIIIVKEYNGSLPRTYDQLIQLPGIGPYTAGAILSIAFNQPYTAVDGNVLRVFARITASKEDIKSPEVKQEIKRLVTDLLPHDRVGDFNQALMEIGALICLPNGKPYCLSCPLSSYCQAYQQDLTEQIPMKQKKAQRKEIDLTILLFKYDDRYSVEKRPEKGLLAGLYQIPNVEGHLTEVDLRNRYPFIKTISYLGEAKHIFTHLEWNMIGYELQLNSPLKEYDFLTMKDIKNRIAIPNAFQYYLNRMQ